MTDEQRQLEFRRRVRSMMVSISATRPSAENQSVKNRLDMLGTIFVANETSCYVVVKRNLIFDDVLYHIVLADGSAMDITSSDFSVPNEEGCLSGFHIRHNKLGYDVSELAAVELGGDVSMCQQVHLCDFYNENLHVTGGQVNHVDGVRFIHSCGPTRNTANERSPDNPPVFDDDGRLVGICVANMQGPTNALSRTTLEKELNKIFGTKDFVQFQSRAEVDGAE